MGTYGPMRLVSIVRDAEWRRHIRLTLGTSPIIRWISQDTELDTTSGLGSANLVLWHIEADPFVAHSMSASVRRIRHAMPSSPIVLYCRVAPAMAHLILQAGRLNVDRVVLRGYDDLARVLADSLQERGHGRACEEILARVAPRDDRATLVVAQCIRRAFDSVLTVDDLAREIGVDRKTLHNRLRSAGLPSPAALISWSRILVAGWLLDDQRRTVGDVARLLHFASASELRGMLSRYVHARATDLRVRGALGAVAQAFNTTRATPTPVSARLPTERREFPNQRLAT